MSFSIAIHGGAGTILQSTMTPELEKKYRQGLTEAITAGITILEKGGFAWDAVEAAIVSLENCELFNAGKGAVFTHDATHELDASIMEGKTLKAGAVSGLLHIKNPISLAKTVMLESQHVMMMGEGAEKFAFEKGFERVENSYFSTPLRLEQLAAIRNTNKTQLDHTVGEIALQDSQNTAPFSEKEKKRGTVGAVVKDKYGNLAAGTSTGGMTNKKHGRIGDTPIIGAGTYANNRTCAVSATGWGEFFIRGVVAYDIAALMDYKELSLEEAANLVIHKKLTELSPIEGELGDGGVIAIDKAGNIAMPFNTEGMYRASFQENGTLFVGLYK